MNSTTRSMPFGDNDLLGALDALLASIARMIADCPPAPNYHARCGETA